MLVGKTFIAVTGTNFIIAAELAYVDVLIVKREGSGYNKNLTTPGDREYTHTTATGKVEFLNNFEPMPDTDPSSSSDSRPERVFVLYKY